MKKSKHNESFQRRIWTVLSLMGLIPYLVGVYVLIEQDIKVTNEIILLAILVPTVILVSFFMIRHFSKDLAKLSDETMDIATGKRKEPVEMRHDSLHEVSTLGQNFNQILSELEETKSSSKEISTRLLVYANDLNVYQEKLRQEALVRAKLSRYVGKDVLEHLVGEGENMPLQNVKREVTVLFADIRSFTTIAESLKPEEVIDMLNEYFSIMVEVIFKHNGVLDKFVGDELMAVFGMIGTSENAPVDAINAALDMRKAQIELMHQRAKLGKPVFEVGTGINTGDAVVGNVGAKNRLDFTVIGDVVNIAARFEQMAQGKQIFIGEKTYQYCKGVFEVKEKGDIQVRNRTEPVRCYEIMG
ncbi:MAG: adenylate/guanylate cyclase domain-containing protein [Mariprofundaceae bacterium]